MRYILNDNGYIQAVSFNNLLECQNKTCTEYTGTVPTGYENLAIWSETANINAYKIVNGNLVFDSEEDARLQSLWGSQEASGVIVESGSNENGSWTKWSDGTMIVNKTLYGTADITNAWGTLYTSATVSLGSFPVSFIERPTIIVSPQTQTGTQYMLTGTSGGNNYGSADYAGSVCLTRPNSRTEVAYVLDVMAKGKWK